MTVDGNFRTVGGIRVAGVLQDRMGMSIALTVGTTRRDQLIGICYDRLASGIRCTRNRNGARLDMYIAMNRFRIHRGRETDFEQVWKQRDSHLEGVPGFIEFRLLRGPVRDDHTLYASHSIWRDEAAFLAWTRSEAFRKAHAGAGGHRDIYRGHPEFEGFETVLTG